MKNHILLFLIASLFCSMTSHSQSNSYFSDGESWAGERWIKQNVSSFYVNNVGDTIINNDTLVKLVHVHGQNQGDTTFYMVKNDTGVLISYYSENGYTDTLKKITIDYSRTDSVTSEWHYFPDSFYEYTAYKINNIDTLFFQGKSVKIFDIEDDCGGSWRDHVYEGTFIDGPNPFFESCFEYAKVMTCYSSHGITYGVYEDDFTQNGNGECFLENVGLPKEETTRFEFYPNPVSEVLTIESQRATEIKIVNIYGQIVYSVDIPKGTKDIDVTGLESGVYLIRSSAGESRRFIKL